jgi:WhiB family redox-sensing transcriptional regulator
MTHWNSFAGALLGIPRMPDALCKGRPELFDEATLGEAPWMVEHRHAEALRLCARCPELLPCKAYLDGLRPAEKPGGVIAGQVRSWATTTRRKEPA